MRMRWIIPAAGLALAGCVHTPAHPAIAPAPDAPAAAATPARSLASDLPFAEADRRLQDAIAARPLSLFAVVDHAEGARSAGLTLAPARLYIFGNPAGGTPIMQASPAMGLELPLRMLVRETPTGSEIAWPDLPSLAAGYGLDPAAPPVARAAALLEAIAAQAASPSPSSD